MPAGRPNKARRALADAASKLIRARGYADVSLDDICTEAGVTRGALHHNFDSKESLARLSLQQWQAGTIALLDQLGQGIADPVERLDVTLGRFVDLPATPGAIRSCLAGTILQETSVSNAELRQSAHDCLGVTQTKVAELIQAACGDMGSPTDEAIDAAGLAEWFVATLQGALILSKGSGDPDSLRRPLGRVHRQIVAEVLRARGRASVAPSRST